MTEHELPRARGNGAGSSESRTIPTLQERQQARFDDLASAFQRGELTRQNEDGTETKIVTFERYVDPLDRQNLQTLTEFRHRAAAVGYREAFSPLVLPTVGVDAPETSHRPLTFVQLGYEQPVKPPAGR
jgi:hypothetical protein